MPACPFQHARLAGKLVRRDSVKGDSPIFAGTKIGTVAGEQARRLNLGGKRRLPSLRAEKGTLANWLFGPGLGAGSPNLVGELLEELAGGGPEHLQHLIWTASTGIERDELFALLPCRDGAAVWAGASQFGRDHHGKQFGLIGRLDIDAHHIRGFFVERQAKQLGRVFGPTCDDEVRPAVRIGIGRIETKRERVEVGEQLVGVDCLFRWRFIWFLWSLLHVLWRWRNRFRRRRFVAWRRGVWLLGGLNRRRNIDRRRGRLARFLAAGFAPRVSA